MSITITEWLQEALQGNAKCARVQHKLNKQELEQLAQVGGTNLRVLVEKFEPGMSEIFWQNVPNSSRRAWTLTILRNMDHASRDLWEATLVQVRDKNNALFIIEPGSEHHFSEDTLERYPTYE